MWLQIEIKQLWKSSHINIQHDIVKSYKISVHTAVKNIVIAHMSAGNLVFPNKTLMKQSSKYSSKQSSEDPEARY